VSEPVLDARAAIRFFIVHYVALNQVNGFSEVKPLITSAFARKASNAAGRNGVVIATRRTIIVVIRHFLEAEIRVTWV
jgi:hypothetical protein